MKKNLLVIVGVVILLGGVIAADRAGMLSRATGGATTQDITDLAGKPLDIDQYKGKVVLLNFWATWCSPCLVEMPWMIGFQEQYAGRGFTVLGVSMDDDGRTSVEPFLRDQEFDVDGRKMRVNYPIFVNSTGVEEQFGGLLGLPTTLVISREGKVVKRFIGLTSHEKLVKEIEALL